MDVTTLRPDASEPATRAPRFLRPPRGVEPAPPPPETPQLAKPSDRWTPPSTLGRRIQEGQRRVRIYDRWYDVKCQSRTIHGLSAHADADELLRFLGPTIRKETTAYVVHGEVDQAEGLAARLVNAGMGNAVVPALESSAVLFSADAQQQPAPARPSRTDNE